MEYVIVFAPDALDDFRSLRAYDRSIVGDAINGHLLHQPTRVSRRRIKRLKGVERPQYRLRVGDLRVFYDVHREKVEVLAIVPKSQAGEWLQRWSKEQ